MPLAFISYPGCIRHEMSTCHPEYPEFLSRIHFFLERRYVFSPLARIVAAHIKALIGAD
ncbi:hypothetical protein [Polynucleobacter asymbioticus]|uniref:hypothetical protein n=1 Tax=Polynucleobacter asymbioticus TaxID=576611 RepID=UPI000B2140E0|nr:hypothetical protein [Polynucleobacter asymbioticus]